MIGGKRDKPHEIYYTERDYSATLDQYEYISTVRLSQDKLLVIAKAYFLSKKYNECLQVLSKIEPTSSTKILFERQSIMFRAAYLLSRKTAPTKEHLTFLRNIIDSFKKLSEKTKGEPFTKHHLARMETYLKFVDVLQKNSQLKISETDLALKERLMAERKATKFEGFPCYLVSELWMEDLEEAIGPQGALEKYIGPLTNFQIVNDIFESHVYDSLEAYKNEFIFPGEKYKLTSKMMWNFYVNTFNASTEFVLLKRLYKKKDNLSHSFRLSTFINELIPLAIDCAGKLLVLQVTQNGRIDKQLLPTLQGVSGLGQLKKRDQQSGLLEILDLEIPLQRSFLNANQIFLYERINQPKIDQNSLYPLLKFELTPIPQTLLRDAQNGLKGFQNLGNSCYMNSCLQCIGFTQQIVAYTTTTNIVEKLNLKLSKGIVVCALADVLKMKWSQSDKTSISPHKFKKYFGQLNTVFSGRTQEDAHQFLLCLLNNLHDELKVVDSRLLKSISKLQVTTDETKVMSYFAKHELEQNKSEITQLLRGIIHNTIICHNCKTASHSYDVFLALSLPIPQKQTPSIYIYFLGDKSKHTDKYEMYLTGVTNVADIFNIFKQEVFINKGKDHVYIMLSIDRVEMTVRQILGELNLAEGSLSTAITLQEVLDSLKCNDIVIYELRRPAEHQDLIIVVYEYDSQILGFPHFIVDQRAKIYGSTQAILRKYVSDTDYQNYVHYMEIRQVEARQIKQATFYKYKLACGLRRRQKIFKGTDFIDKELNAMSQAFALNDCFNMMRQPETLENSWQCGKCKSNKRGEKKEQITLTSGILIITLKRFKADYRKIKGMVTYPVDNLDITEWMEDPKLATHKYELYAVCLHQGTAEFGHYRAYCKHFVTGEWYEFDDKFVRKITVEDVVSPFAYMLFYRRREI